MSTSPISSSASPTTSVSSNSAHPLKKRLISEYELEQQQQRNSPVIKSPTPPTTEEPVNNSNTTISEQNLEEVSDVDTAKEATVNSTEETESST
jgi:hypothetical protein